MTFQVFNRILQSCDVLLEKADTNIAVVAKKAAHFACAVAMIKVQLFSVAIRATNGASAILRSKKRFVFGQGDAIPFPQQVILAFFGLEVLLDTLVLIFFTFLCLSVGFSVLLILEASRFIGGIPAYCRLAPVAANHFFTWLTFIHVSIGDVMAAGKLRDRFCLLALRAIFFRDGRNLCLICSGLNLR